MADTNLVTNNTLNLKNYNKYKKAQKAFQIHRVIKYKHLLPGEYCCLQEDFSIFSHKKLKVLSNCGR